MVGRLEAQNARLHRLFLEVVGGMHIPEGNVNIVLGFFIRVTLNPETYD